MNIIYVYILIASLITLTYFISLSIGFFTTAIMGKMIFSKKIFQLGEKTVRYFFLTLPAAVLLKTLNEKLEISFESIDVFARAFVSLILLLCTLFADLGLKNRKEIVLNELHNVERFIELVKKIYASPHILPKERSNTITLFRLKNINFRKKQKKCIITLKKLGLISSIANKIEIDKKSLTPLTKEHIDQLKDFFEKDSVSFHQFLIYNHILNLYKKLRRNIYDQEEVDTQLSRIYFNLEKEKTFYNSKDSEYVILSIFSSNAFTVKTTEHNLISSIKTYNKRLKAIYNRKSKMEKSKKSLSIIYENLTFSSSLDKETIFTTKIK